MFSNSSSYLGGGNSARPGLHQSNQPSYMYTGQPTQSSPMQPGSLGQVPLQQQYTAFNGPGQVPHNYQATPQQPQQTGFPPQHPQQSNQAPPQPSLPLRTGQTSAQVAQSFTSAPSQSPSVPSSASSTKIPKIRLSFLTATDQAKFEQLFKSAVGENQALDGEKCKDLLLRSKLPGPDLMKIWTLSDTTKSGQLLFPEFALAMYLCNLKLVGKDLPPALPEKIANEVSSMVDIISFGVPDDRPLEMNRTNAPSFNNPPTSNPSTSIHQPQPQTSNSHLLSQINSQPTGFASQYIPPQPTGFVASQGGFQSQPIGSVHQQQQNSMQQGFQTGGYDGPRPPMPPMPSTYTSSLSPSQTGQASLPLSSQPTGRPGQWGFVNAPASGLPNIEALQQRMMPQPGREGGYTTAGLAGSASVPWAVTKDEKQIYDQLFRAWDGFSKGFIGGDVAIEVMGQSGLPKIDLERIWTLADPNNKGRLDMDEFAVAMHLIYRKLNGYPVPNQLPPELVPPSTRNFSNSINTVKSLLSQDAETRKSSGAFLQPQKTGVSYLKNHSFRTDSSGIVPSRKDATIFRHNDDDVGYKSSARRRFGAGGGTPSPAPSASPVSERSGDEVSIEQLRKQIREKQILLDAMDFDDQNAVEEEDALDRKDRREAEDLYRRIRRLQEEIDTHPKAALHSDDSGAERRALKRQLQRLTDNLPELASQIRKLERGIAESKMELFRLKDAKTHPDNASTIVGTGPGGVVTEGDRLKARAKAMMQQRSAALMGKPFSATDDDGSAAERRAEEENSNAKAERENNERMIQEVEESVRQFSVTLEDSLAQGDNNSSSEHERRRWDEGLGVEDEVRDFIFDLQRSKRAARVRQQDRQRDGSYSRARSPQPSTSREVTPKGIARQPNGQASAKPASSSGASYSSYKTAEDRAAFIKQQAEQRMAERLAALGLKAPSKAVETPQQKQDREGKERQERMRRAEEEDTKREDERQRKLAHEQPTSPPTAKSVKKAPPAPPIRKARADSAAKRASSKPEEPLQIAKAEHEGMEKAIKEQQQVQASETKAIETEAQRQEAELEEERQASQARLKALEEQVKQGKVRKQEEKRRKQAAERESKERESRVAAQRAELEAARERERQLELQLNSIGDEDSSDEEDPQELTPKESSPSGSQSLSQESSQQVSEDAHSPNPEILRDSSAKAPSVAQAPTVPSAPSALERSSSSAESKNPYFKRMSQVGESSAAPPSVSSPPAAVESTNPFHRLAQQQEANKAQAVAAPPIVPGDDRPSRIRPEEDEWSAVGSTSSSDDEDGPEKPTSGSAKHLASILFGTMGPPRPLSAADEKKAVDEPHSPAPPTPGNRDAASPPPAPPMPGSFDPDSGAPSAPPPPPPPPAPASGGAPPAPPAPPAPAAPSAPLGGLTDRSGLLGDIQKGKGLKKVQTKDRSSAATAGKVLN